MASNEQELQETLKSDSTLPSENRVNVEEALKSMNFSNAAKQLLLNPNAPQTDLDSLQSIALTQEHLTQVKKSLDAIVDSLQENPSLISRAAKFWGELPIWQRILGGVVISGPSLVIGAAAHIGFLVTISGVSALAYTTSGFVLDDHHLHTKSIAQKLKEGIFGVAEVLELTIGALDSIRRKLAIEVQRFKTENDTLTKNITQLNDDIDTLTMQVEVYIKTEELLRKQKTDLEKIATTLKQDLETQGTLFKTNQETLDKIKGWHERSLTQLSEKTAELALVRKSMGDELDKAKKISSTLENTIKIFTSSMISDTNQRQAFQEKLGDFLSQKTTNFDQVAERMSDAEKELSEVKSQLQASNERYKQLLTYQEQLISRLERLDQCVDLSIHPESVSANLPNPSPNQEPVKSGILLSTLSFLTSPLWSNTVPKIQQSAEQKEEKKVTSTVP